MSTLQFLNEIGITQGVLEAVARFAEQISHHLRKALETRATSIAMKIERFDPRPAARRLRRSEEDRKRSR
jgi:hypothetical protein